LISKATNEDSFFPRIFNVVYCAVISSPYNRC